MAPRKNQQPSTASTSNCAGQSQQKKARAGLLNMPAKTLLKIFSYLPPETINGTLTKVSKGFRTLIYGYVKPLDQIAKVDLQRKTNILEPFRSVQDVPDLKAAIMKFEDYSNITLLENLARTTNVQALQIKMAIGFQDHDGWRDAEAWKLFGDVTKQLQYLEIQDMTDLSMKHLGHTTMLNTLRVDNLQKSREMFEYFASPEKKVDSVMTLLLGAQDFNRGGCYSSPDEGPTLSWSRKFANLRVLWLGYKKPMFYRGINSLLSNLGMVSTQCMLLETFCMDIDFMPDNCNCYKNKAQEELDAVLGTHFAFFTVWLKRFRIRIRHSGCRVHMEEKEMHLDLTLLGHCLIFSLGEYHARKWSKCRTGPKPMDYYIKLESPRAPDNVYRPKAFSEIPPEEWICDEETETDTDDDDDEEKEEEEEEQEDVLSNGSLGKVLEETPWILEELQKREKATEHETVEEEEEPMDQTEVDKLIAIGKTVSEAVKKEEPGSPTIKPEPMDDAEINALVAIGADTKSQEVTPKTEIKEEHDVKEEDMDETEINNLVAVANPIKQEVKKEEPL